MVTYKKENKEILLFLEDDCVAKASDILKISDLKTLLCSRSREELLEKIFEAEVRRGKELLLRWLGIKALFCKEAGERLLQRNVSPLAVEEILSSVSYLLQDHITMEGALRSSFRKGKGIRAVERSAGRFMRVVYTAEVKDQEKQALTAFLTKKKMKVKDSSFRDRQRLIALLLRRGFSMASIEDVFSEFLEGNPLEE